MNLIIIKDKPMWFTWHSEQNKQTKKRWKIKVKFKFIDKGLLFVVGIPLLWLEKKMSNKICIKYAKN